MIVWHRMMTYQTLYSCEFITLTKLMNSNRAKLNNTNRPRVVGNQISTTRTPTKRGRRKARNRVPTTQGITRLPPIFRGSADVNSMRLSTSYAFTNTENKFAKHIISLAPVTVASADYWGLANFFPLLAGLRNQYARFMLTRVMIQAVPVTAATAGGFVAIGFQADDSNTSGPPGSLVDVTSALHSDVAQVTEIAAFELDASDYYNEWRQCSPTDGTSTNLSQAGVVQIYGSNILDLPAGPVVILHMEVDIHFAGFRKIGA